MTRPDPAPLTQLLHQAGLRGTRMARAVLALFAQAPAHWSPTHAEVAARLAAEGHSVHSVTLYRLLDRLVAAGLLARRTASDARVWHFQWQGPAAACPTTDAIHTKKAHKTAAAEADPPPVPHFECDACHTQLPLQDPGTLAMAEALRRTLAAQGHQPARMDLAVHGTCAECREAG